MKSQFLTILEVWQGEMSSCGRALPRGFYGPCHWLVEDYDSDSAGSESRFSRKDHIDRVRLFESSLFLCSRMSRATVQASLPVRTSVLLARSASIKLSGSQATPLPSRTRMSSAPAIEFSKTL